MLGGNPLALAYLTVNNSEPVEQIEAAAASGFDSVGLRLLPPGNLKLAHEILGNQPLIGEIRRACQRTGVNILDVDVFTLSAAGDSGLLDRAVDAAAEIGASIILTVCEDPDRSRAIERFAALCSAAAERHMRVAMEFMRWREVRTIEDALAFIDSAGSANGAICVDTLHLSRSGGTPASIAAAPASRMPYLQISDAPAQAPPVQKLLHEARYDRLYPGEGELGLDEVLDAMPRNIPISIEVPRSIHATRRVSDRAKLAAEALRLYLAKYQARGHSVGCGRSD
jgi:sugar phosphate isomerase/epimerase